MVTCAALGVATVTESSGVTQAVATAASQHPAISFQIKPTDVDCRDRERPHRATVYWHVTHDVSRVTISGVVDRTGHALDPIVVARGPHRRDVHGHRSIYVLCTGTTQVLILTATGSGGTSTATASLGENHA